MKPIHTIHIMFCLLGWLFSVAASGEEYLVEDGPRTYVVEVEDGEKPPEGAKKFTDQLAQQYTPAAIAERLDGTENPRVPRDAAALKEMVVKDLRTLAKQLDISPIPRRKDDIIKAIIDRAKPQGPDDDDEDFKSFFRRS